MLSPIAEHTPERLMIRRYWSGQREGWHTRVQGVVFLGVAIIFVVTSARFVEWWVTALVILVGGTLGVSFVLMSRYQGRRFEEGRYTFDKPRGTFELLERNERRSDVKSYPLTSVREAVVREEPDDENGPSYYLEVRLLDNTGVYIHWFSGQPDEILQLTKLINDFLGMPKAQP